MRLLSKESISLSLRLTLMCLLWLLYPHTSQSIHRLQSLTHQHGYREDSISLELRTGSNYMTSNSSRRDKRALGTSPENTTFTLTEKNPVLDTVKPGDPLGFNFEIDLPGLSDSTDYLVEIQSYSHPNGNSVAHFCSANVAAFGTGVTSTNSSVQVSAPGTKGHTSTLGQLVEKVQFNLGNLSTSGPASDDTNKISMDFDLVISNTALLNNDFVSVVVGVLFNNTNMLHLSEITKTVLTNDSPNEAQATVVTSPASLKRGATSILEIEVALTHPIVDFKVIAFNIKGYDDIWHIGDITILPGLSYQCNDWSYKRSNFLQSTEKLSNGRAETYLTDMINTDSTRDIAKADNTFHIEVPITVLSDTSRIGTQDIALGILLDNTDVWVSVQNITILEDVAPAPTIVDPTSLSLSLLDSEPIPHVSLALVEINIEVPPESSVNLEIKLTGDAQLIPSTVTLKHPGSCGLINNSPSCSGTPLICEFGIATNPSKTATIVKMVGSFFVENGTADGQIDVSVDVGSKSDSVQVEVLGSAQKGQILASPIDFGFQDSLLYSKTEVGMQMKISFGKHTSFDTLKLLALSDMDVLDYDLRLCNVRVRSIQSGLPCANIKTLNKRVNMIKNESRKFIDEANVEWALKDTCLTGISDTMSDNTLIAEAVYQLPHQDSISNGQNITTTLGWAIGNNTVFVSVAKRITDSSPLNNTEVSAPFTNTDPFIISTSDIEVANGGVSHVRYVIKFRPKTRGNYLLVFETMDANSPVCSLKVTHIGDNMPCAQKPEGYLDKYAQTKLSYSNGKAYLEFEGLTNWGSTSIKRNNYADDDSIEVIAFFKFDDLSTGPLNVIGRIYTGMFYENSNSSLRSFKVSGSSIDSGSATMQNFSLSVGDLYKKYPIVATVEVQALQGMKGIVSLTVKNALFASEKYLSFCELHISKVGLNFPCMNYSTEYQYLGEPAEVLSSEGKPLKYYEGVTMDIEIQHYPFSNNPADDLINIEVILQVPLNYVGTVTLEAELGAEVKTIDFTVSDIPDDFGGQVDSDFMVETDTEEIYGEVGWKKWVPFTIKLPSTPTIPLVLGFMTPSKDARAILTVLDVRFAKGGINICCANPLLEMASLYDVIANQTSNVTTFMQTDFLTVDMGFTLNGHFALKRGLETPKNNQLVVEILVQITDHAETINGSVHNIGIAARSHDTIATGSRAIKVLRKTTLEIRQGLDRPTVLTNITMENKNFTDGEKINVQAVIHHANYSRGEALTGQVQFILPGWIGYQYNGSAPDAFSSNYSSAVVIEMPNGPMGTILRFKFDKGITFSDYIGLNFTLSVNPWDNLFYGEGIVKSVIVAQIHCSTEKFGTFPTTSTAMLICGPYTQAPLSVKKRPECSDVIPVTTCGIRGSTARSDTNLPSNVLDSNSGEFWVPAVRKGALWKDYLIFDFLQMYRVSRVKLTFPTDTGYIKPTEVSIFSSELGLFWNFVIKQVIPGDGEVIFPVVYAKMMKIVIETANADIGSKPLAIESVTWKGCLYSSNTTASGCPSFQTPLSNSITDYRHMSLDPVHLIAYYCDINPRLDFTMKCYSYVEATQKHVSLPRDLSHIIGFDETTEKVYFRGKTGSLLASKDGSRIQIFPENTSPPSGVVPPTNIPGELDFSEVTHGKLSSNFDFLFLDGTKIATWASSCCTP